MGRTVISHLHFDHVGGISQIPQAELWVSAREWAILSEPRTHIVIDMFGRFSRGQKADKRALERSCLAHEVQQFRHKTGRAYSPDRPGDVFRVSWLFGLSQVSHLAKGRFLPNVASRI
ncbi:MBL fold metallo-hydrolase [Ruegeria arenilitoris]|uniref:MBL fold metallo-hydrolase n=1 Tax=Ruegeria arenilitoris TaxID=1173585 RepID=UPI00147E55E9